jgi:Zn-dependent M28 family amino/carboxypeptidase
LVAALVGLSAAAPARPGDDKVAAPAAPAAAPKQATMVVDPADVVAYREHVITLANPFFDGRMPGSRGNALAADYIEAHFKALGFTPAFPAGADGGHAEGPTFRQSFEFGRRTDVTKAAVKYGSTELKPGSDFNVLGISGNATVTGPLAFVGYSLTEGPAPDHKTFSSFKEGDDLTGKIAFIFRFEPVNAEGKSAFTNDRWSNAAALYPKLEAAAKRGAAAIIIAPPPGAKDERIDSLQTAQETARLGRALDIPVVMMTIPAAEALVRAADSSARSLADLRAIADTSGHGMIELAKTPVTIEAGLERTPRTTDNVAGVLPGKGALASQYIIVGAHYDHVGDNSLGGGRGPVGVIHPGADDNASGTSGLLMNAAWIAEHYKTLPADANVRSVLFMAFSAEEMGLVGSRYFVKNPSVPASSIDAMLNMDMIGRLRDNKLELAGVGTAKDFQAIIQPLLDSSGLTVNALPGGRGPSDHASFYAESVPVLHFFTGLHDVYHTPGDVSSTINFDGGALVAKLCAQVAIDLATRPERLEFTSSSGPSMPDERPSRSGQAASGPGMANLKIRFGIAPGAYAEGDVGVLVGEVYPNTSAGDAGIKAGDRLIKWNGEAIGDVADWMAKMSKHEPGDEVDVTVLRDKAEQVIKVKLKARERGQR